MTDTSPRLTRRRLLQAALAGTTTASLFAGSGRLAFARQAGTTRRTRAVLVGIGPYPFLPDIRQLSGASEDVRRMKLLMQIISGGAGKPDDVLLLENENATAANVRAALKTILEKTGPGDGVTFYWSGRGSLRPAADGENAARNAEPTLVPYDGQENSGAGDIGLDEIAAWAQKAVHVCGASENVLVVVDASFYAPPSRGGIRQGRVVNPEPRCIPRTGLRPRRALWQGAESSGVFLCAAGSSGLAHEEQPVVGKWHGIFTDQFVLRTADSFLKHQVSTPTEFLTHLAQWSVGKGLDDWKPYPPLPTAEAGGEDALAASGTLGGAYFKPLLGINPEGVGTTAGQTTPIQAEVATQIKAQQEREKWLRFAVCVAAPESADSGGAAESTAASAATETALLTEVRSCLQGVSPSYALLLPPQIGPVDRLVEVNSKADGGYRVRVSGMEVDALIFGEGIDASNRDALRQILQNDIAPYLRVQALAKRLYLLGEKGQSGGTTLETHIFHLDKAQKNVKENVYNKDDIWGMSVTASRPGWLFCLERWGQEGMVQMVWPFPQDAVNTALPQSKPRPIPAPPRQNFDMGWQITNKMPSGTVDFRLVLVSPQAGAEPLPPLPADLLADVATEAETSVKEAAFRKVAPQWNVALAAHLEAAVSALEKNKASLWVHDYSYQVRPLLIPASAA